MPNRLEDSSFIVFQTKSYATRRKSIKYINIFQYGNTWSSKPYKSNRIFDRLSSHLNWINKLN